MKKLIATVLTLLSCGVVYALPLGNPTEASLFQRYDCDGTSGCCDPCDPCFFWLDSFSFGIGFYGDYVFNCNLRIDGKGLNQGHAIRETELYTNAGYVVGNFCEMIDIFGTVGASHIRLETSEISWIADGDANGILESDTSISWSVGARATVFQWRCLGIGIEGQYFRFSPDFTKYWSLADGKYTYFNKGNGTKYQEWQVGGGVSYTFTTFCQNFSWVPYTGVKYACAKFDTNDFSFIRLPGTDSVFTIFDLKSNKHWGYVVGITMTMCDMLGLTVEGRFGDELALYVNGQARF